MSEKTFKAFSDQALTIEALNIESAADQVALYGDLTISRDQEGLKKAKELKSVIETIIKQMEEEPLPEKLEKKPVEKVKNPF